ncbi:ImmA/IrrE family metallo-endopeptidase [Mannheimia pernigra]|uniref:ImmA/IrrE family metallo-endopeptidase n=1 Tax=Mannheimia pernigra TaxID=111844 RepID=UPI001CEF59F2|nr:ImmA/IrrE family metallo-endopeptidase [Mannheimia pernigra]
MPPTLGNIEYRKKANTPVKVLKQIEADVLDQAERWLELAYFWEDFPINKFSLDFNISIIDSLDGVEDIAEKLRNSWQLGLDPLPNLIDLFESKGILVIVSDVEQSSKFDGLQAHINDLPIIVVSAHWGGARQRFTLAHELGHLVLHEHLSASIDEEQACHRFASAFLLPKESAIKKLGNQRSDISIYELGALKQEFGLSMQACLRRAKDLSIVSESLYKNKCIFFSTQGWRKNEPNEELVKPERTLLFKQLTHRALAENIITESKAAELLKVSLIEFNYQHRGVNNATVAG